MTVSRNILPLMAAAVVDVDNQVEQAHDYTVSGVPATRLGQTVDHHLHTGKPWLGFNGLGWYDNPVDSYAVPPIDNLDYAAFQHDKAYDRVGANGPESALFDKRTAFDDLQFAKSAFNNSSQGWGVAAGLLFELTGWYKLYHLAIGVPF